MAATSRCCRFSPMGIRSKRGPQFCRSPISCSVSPTKGRAISATSRHSEASSACRSRRKEYIKRSPLYHVDKLKVPVLVHVATNDTDVDFVEDQQIIDALRSRKSDLAETKVYVDPAAGAASGGHTFSRRVNP